MLAFREVLPPMWNIIFYECENGRIPVQEFINSLSRQQRAKAIHEIEILEQFGTELKMPHAKHIDGKLWELRIKAGNDISRIFYFIHTGNHIILLHGFIKKTQKTPAAEISKAKTYLSNYEGRTENDFSGI
jgi:phage-related protein